MNQLRKTLNAKFGGLAAEDEDDKYVGLPEYIRDLKRETDKLSNENPDIKIKGGEETINYIINDPTVIDMLIRIVYNSSNLTVIEKALGTLSVVCRHSQPLKSIICRHGGIDMLIKLLTHSTMTIRQYACHVLIFLLISELKHYTYILNKKETKEAIQKIAKEDNWVGWNFNEADEILSLLEFDLKHLSKAKRLWIMVKNRLPEIVSWKLRNPSFHNSQASRHRPLGGGKNLSFRKGSMSRASSRRFSITSDAGGMGEALLNEVPPTLGLLATTTRNQSQRMLPGGPGIVLSSESGGGSASSLIEVIPQGSKSFKSQSHN